MILKKFLNSRASGTYLKENLKKGIITDRYEILKKLKKKFPEIELNSDVAYYNKMCEKYIRTSDEDISDNKINEDEGFGFDDKINGDFSYNISVSC